MNSFTLDRLIYVLKNPSCIAEEIIPLRVFNEEKNKTPYQPKKPDAYLEYRCGCIIKNIKDIQYYMEEYKDENWFIGIMEDCKMCIYMGRFILSSPLEESSMKRKNKCYGGKETQLCVDASRLYDRMNDVLEGIPIIGHPKHIYNDVYDHYYIDEKSM